MSANGGEEYVFLMKRHKKFFLRCLHVLPYSTKCYDTSRVTVLFFALSGLDIMNALDEISDEERCQIIDWIYSLQVPPSEGSKSGGGFRGGSSLASVLQNEKERPQSLTELDCGHITMTYTALASLLILGDDLSRIDREGIRKHIKSLQCDDGSFLSTTCGSENDMRFIYCASTICYMLKDFSPLDIESATKYIIRSMSYEGGIGQGPSQESHGGSTFCGIAALHLMNKLDDLSTSQREKLLQWLVLRQVSEEGGLQGRPNKPADTCYSFWVGASLKLLGGFHYLNHESLVQFVLSTQDPITGGLGKFAGVNPDGLHTYLGISGLALIDPSVSGLQLNCVDPSLNISKRALQHLESLHQNWLHDS